jgi:PmbA protein
MTQQMLELGNSEDRLKNLVEDILAQARVQGADAAEVSVSEDVGLGVTVRMGELETVEFNHDRGFGITLYYGHRKGAASTSDSSTEAIRDTVSAAANIAKHTQEDTCNGLADESRMPDVLPQLDLYHPWDIDPGSAETIARECEAVGRSHDTQITSSDGAQVSSQQSCRVYGNSHGFMGSYVGTRHSVSCVLIAKDASGMQRDYWYTVARDPALMESAEAVGVEAARRTVAKLAPRRIATGRFPVVFSAQAAAGLAGHLLGAISGGALYRKASFLLDSLGNTVAAGHLRLSEEPHLPGQLGSAGFDGDGVGTQNKAFINDGVVENYVLSTYSARKLGMETTGNAGGVFNLTMTGKTIPAVNLFKEMRRGLVVTDLMGQGVNSVTGDYSRGASGFWVEDGELVYPVDEITIAANMRDMFKDIVCLGDDLDIRGNIRTPSVLIGSMTLAGE